MMTTAVESPKAKTTDAEPPIIIKKVSRGHEGHHGGAWKVAYADFVTAMMAFFLVLWIVGLSDEVKENIAAYFSDPMGFADQVAAGEGPLNRHPGRTIDADQRVIVVDVEALLREKAAQIRDALETLPGFSEIEEQIVIEVTAEGLRIQLLESETASFFDVGSAKLSARGVEAVTTIGKKIASLPYDLVVEGHTDSRPYSGRSGYTNWELSADRANAARRVLEGAGVVPAHVKSIRGYADVHLRFPDDPQDARNRRIAILVQSPATKHD